MRNITSERRRRGSDSRAAVSCWDPLIVAAADTLGAHLVYSEDLNNGQIYGSVRVANPFV